MATLTILLAGAYFVLWCVVVLSDHIQHDVVSMNRNRNFGRRQNVLCAVLTMKSLIHQIGECRTAGIIVGVTVFLQVRFKHTGVFLLLPRLGYSSTVATG